MRKKDNQPWTITRPSHDLSARNPILCFQHQHDRQLEAAYDMHYAVELGIVAAGRIRRIYQDCEKVYGRGEVWLNGMWEPHGFQSLSKECALVVCVIWPPFLAKLQAGEGARINWLAPFSAPPGLRPFVARNRRRCFLSICERFHAISKTPEPRRGVWYGLLVQETLLELTRDWPPPTVPAQPPHDGFNKINRAIEMVFSRKRFIAVDEAARQCAMGRNRFSRLFRDVMGLGFAQFAQRNRLSGAARQLALTGDPIKAVARDWGFTDDSHLHRLFSEHYGMSPLIYRKRQQSNKKQ